MSTEKPSMASMENPASLQKSKTGTSLLVVGGVAAFVIIALALGLGLGLGLKKHHTSSPASSSTPLPTSTIAPPLSGTNSTASQAVPSWRRDPADYNLDMSWDINAAPTTRLFNLTISEIQAAPDGTYPRQVNGTNADKSGVTRTTLVYNGQFPGPVIRVNRGDRVLVNVTNQLTNATTVHWHGLYQNGTNWMDGTASITQCGIPPGKSFLYNFTVENQFGTYWYHSHHSTQYTDGLVGPFIVHAPDESDVQKTYDFDQIILLQDWYHDLSTVLLPDYLSSGNENAEPVPDNGLIQGTNYFNCSNYDPDSGYDCAQNSSQATFAVAQDKRYRLRLINTGAFAEFQFSIDNHSLSVIEADSTLVQPLTVQRIPIHTAQRYSVILHTNQSASTNYWMHAHMNTGCFSNDNSPILDPDVKALVTYTNTTYEPTASVDWSSELDQVCEDLDSALLVPLVSQAAPERDVTYALDVSFQIGAYEEDKAYINSTTWTPAVVPTLNQAIAGLHATNSSTFSSSGVSTAFSSSQFVIAIPPATGVVDVLINSFDEGAHPFHLHGHQFWIMATGATGDFNWARYSNGGLNTTNPMRRDTMTIDAYGWALIRFRADNPGMWALHCHISWHMESGLLMQFMERSDILGTLTIPGDVMGLCDG